MDITTRTDWAGHLDDRWRTLVETVERGMAEADGLSYVAHFTDGIYNFGIARSTDPADPAAERDAVADAVAVTRQEEERYQRIGRRLNLVHEDLERWTRPLDSGRLIRLVFASGNGAVLLFTVRPHEYMVGYARGADRIETADRQLAKTTDDVRKLLGLGSENPGGYHPVPITLDEARAATRHVHVPDEARGAAFAQVHRRHVCRTDLHYLAAFVGGRQVSAVDTFEDASVGRFFLGITPQARRDIYLDIVSELEVLVRRLTFPLRPVLDGALSRVVLDVEQGALYYRVLPEGAALLGVTLDQEMVWEAERRLDKAIAGHHGDDAT